MRLIKAFVRTTRVDEIIRSLEASGAPGITVSIVHGVGYGYDPYLFNLAPNELRRAPELAKVEVVCLRTDVDRLVAAVVRAARTGAGGDGIVFVTPVERALKVRNGAEGPAALGSDAPRD